MWVEEWKRCWGLRCSTSSSSNPVHADSLSLLLSTMDLSVMVAADRKRTGNFVRWHPPLNYESSRLRPSHVQWNWLECRKRIGCFCLSAFSGKFKSLIFYTNFPKRSLTFSLYAHVVILHTKIRRDEVRSSNIISRTTKVWQNGLDHN